MYGRTCLLNLNTQHVNLKMCKLSGLETVLVLYNPALRYTVNS